MGEGYAWVTLATNDSYSLGALVLAHSLKQVGTGHQLAVLVTPGVTSAMRDKLSAVFNIVQEVNILDSKDETNLRLLKRPELGVTFTKLHCWRLTQFDKCVFLDADTLVLRNCDELFDREELSAAPDVGWPDCFNSGVFVYKPSNDTYEKLVQFALERGSFDGGDQGLLNLYFSDWATKDISKHLPFIYNLCSTASYSYLPAFKQFGVDAKIIHFIGNSKPWLQYFNTETRQVQPSPELKHLEAALQYWWNIFCSVIHPQLTPDMARSSSDVTHTSMSSCTTQNHDKPEPSSTKNLIWDPWEEYDQKQSFVPPPLTESFIVQEKSFVHESHAPYTHQVQIFEPSQIKPIESHNTNAYVSYEHSQTTYDQPLPHQNCNPPLPPFQKSHSTSSIDVRTKISPSPPPPSTHHHVHAPEHIHVPEHHASEHHVHVSEHHHVSKHNTHVPEHVHVPEHHVHVPEHHVHVPEHHVHVPEHHVHVPKHHVHVPEHHVHVPASLETIYSSQDSQQTELLTCAPKPIAPTPHVQSNECEAAATVCKEITLHTAACEDEPDTGLAGAFAQLTLGAPRTAEQSALDGHLRRQGWETGNIDYMGRDSFDNIWNKICETLSAGLPQSEAETTTEATSSPTGTTPPEKLVSEASLKLSEISSTQDSTLTPETKLVSEIAVEQSSTTIPAEEGSTKKESAPKDVISVEQSTDSKEESAAKEVAPPAVPTEVAPPAETAPVPIPAEVSPATIPAEVAPVTIPAEVAPATIPAEVAPVTIPAEVAPTTIPAEVAPAPIPAEVAPATIPAEVAPATILAEVTPAATPAEVAPTVPLETAPAILPEVAPAAVPSEIAPPSVSTESAPAAVSSEAAPVAVPSKVAPVAVPSKAAPSAVPPKAAPSAVTSETTPIEAAPAPVPSGAVPVAVPSEVVLSAVPTESSVEVPAVISPTPPGKASFAEEAPICSLPAKVQEVVKQPKKVPPSTESKPTSVPREEKSKKPVEETKTTAPPAEVPPTTIAPVSTGSSQESVPPKSKSLKKVPSSTSPKEVSSQESIPVKTKSKKVPPLVKSSIETPSPTSPKEVPSPQPAQESVPLSPKPSSEVPSSPEVLSTPPPKAETKKAESSETKPVASESTAPESPTSKTGESKSSKTKADPASTASGASPTPPPRKTGGTAKKVKAKK